MKTDNKTKLIDECSNEELETIVIKTTKILRNYHVDTRKSESFWKAIQIQLLAMAELEKRDKVKTILTADKVEKTMQKVTATSSDDSNTNQ